MSYHDSMPRTFHRPVSFDGTSEQIQANRASHAWSQDLDGEIRCVRCDHKAWHVGASWPCGSEVPREEVTM